MNNTNLIKIGNIIQRDEKGKEVIINGFLKIGIKDIEKVVINIYPEKKSKKGSAFKIAADKFAINIIKFMIESLKKIYHL